jgi:hypothetical protein
MELTTLQAIKILAGLAMAGGVTAGAVGLGAGLATADPTPARGHVFADWPPPPPPPHPGDPGWGGRPSGQWNGGPGPGQWNGGPGPAAWGPPPGTWNGGWEPDGGVCLFAVCV